MINQLIILLLSHNIFAINEYYYEDYVSSSDLSDDDFTTDYFYEIPELTTKKVNDPYIVYGPKTGSDKQRQYFVFSRYNSTHDVYRVKSFALLPGKKADTPLMRVGKFIGAVPILKRGLGVKCWDDIGCFSAINTEDKNIGMLPMSPKQIDIKFQVYTFLSQKKSFELSHNFDINDMKRSTFNYSHQTVLIVHGFKSGIKQWMIDIKDMLFSLKFNAYNVILIDWNRGSNPVNYILAAANTQVVGALIAFFVNRICETTFENKIKNDMFYLIGHSLGAHIMGFAGKRLIKPKVSRITGLDPAGPIFQFYPPEGRLYYNDATQVDAIHTDLSDNLAAGLGISDAVGDMDFYPNGGKIQPGCPLSQMIENALKYPTEVSCSHSRSYALVNSFGNVDDYCLPIGYMCENWERFIEGRCANCETFDGISQCQLMGLYPTYWKSVMIDNKPGVGQKYYLNTAKDDKYCVYHFQMAFHFSKDSNFKSNGEFELTINAEVNKKKEELKFKRDVTKIYSGKIHTILVTFRSIVKFKSLSLQWFRFKRMLSIGNKVKIDFIEINYMSHISEKVRQQLSVLLCPSSSSDQILADGPKVMFSECNNQTKPVISALNKQASLMPLTISKNILSVDYENQDIIRKKILNTNL